MSVHPLHPRRTPGNPTPTDASANDGGWCEAADDDRFGSFDDSNRLAHRVITPLLLAGHSGVPLGFCEVFHLAFFDLLEAIGDFDGLVVVDDVQFGARVERLAVGTRWLADHPAPDVDAMRAEIYGLDDVDVDIDAMHDAIRLAVADHSLTLASVADSNPSLTFGSVDSLVDRLDDAILEIAISTCPQYTEAMTKSALVLLKLVAASVRVVGGAHVRTTASTS